MKRARMLTAPACLVLATAIGCTSAPFAIWPQSRPAGSRLSKNKLISEPATISPPASAPAEETAADPVDPKAALVSQRVNEFLSQLPGNDPGRDSQVSGIPTPAGQAGNRDPSPQTRPAASTPPRPAPKPAPVQPGDDAARLPSPPVLTSASRPAPDNTAVMASPQAAPPRLASATPRGPRIELIDVRPAIRPGQPTTTAPAGASANSPTTGAMTSPIPSDLAAMIAQLEQTVHEHPEQLDDQLKLRLLYLVTGQDEKAVAPLHIGDPLEAEFLTALLRTLRHSKNMIADPAGKDPSVLAALDELRRLLGQRLPVSIPRIALVTRINSFGDYQAVNPPRFPAGKPVHVFLYTEVCNFRSEPADDGKLQTVLAGKIEIFDSTGKIVWQRAEPSIIDRVVTPRHDFFIPFPVNLPGELPAGEYILKVTIEDKLGATADQQRLTFTVGE